MHRGVIDERWLELTLMWLADHPKATAHETAQSLYELGTLAMKRQDHDAAMAFWHRIETELPQTDSFPEAVIAIAGLLRQRGELGEARARLERLVDMHRHHSRAWLALGDVRFLTGDYEGAMQAYSKSEQAYPPSFCGTCAGLRGARAGFRHALCIEQAGKTDEAVQLYFSIIRSHWDHYIHSSLRLVDIYTHAGELQTLKRLVTAYERENRRELRQYERSPLMPLKDIIQMRQDAEAEFTGGLSLGRRRA